MEKKHNDRYLREGFPDGWHVQDRLDENAALLIVETPGMWPGTKTICVRPKAMTTDSWLHTARAIANAMVLASAEEGRLRTGMYWDDFEEAVLQPPSPESVALIAASQNMTAEAVVEAFRRESAGAKVFMNNIYQVQVRDAEVVPGWPPMLWLSIKRIDRAPVGVEQFRDFQRIKNELVGETHEAVELYPSEARLVDMANQYHLWCFRDAGSTFPFGMGGRGVSYESVGGARQRPAG